MKPGLVPRARWLGWVAIVASVVSCTAATADSVSGGGRAACWTITIVAAIAGLLWLLLPRRLDDPSGIRRRRRGRGTPVLPWAEVGGLEISRHYGWRLLSVTATGDDQPVAAVWEPLMRGTLEDVAAPLESAASVAVSYATDDARERGRPAFAWAQIVAGLCLVVGFVMVFTVVPAFYVHTPAASTAGESLVRVVGRPPHPSPRGGVVLVLGTAERQAHLFDLVRPAFSDVALGPRGEAGTPVPVVKRAGRRDADNSAAAARYAALVRKGRPLVLSGSGVEVMDVGGHGPAQGHLHVGDVIVGANGNELKYGEQLGSLLRALAPGSEVVLDVTNGTGARRQESVIPQHGLLGIRFVTAALALSGADDVELSVSSFSGPSGGLALCLGVLDVLGDGDVSRGRVIAVTGTMSPDGMVGRVGGIPLKMVAAMRAHASLVIVPASQIDDARRAVHGRVAVIGVGTLDEALAALAR
ncbi:MAG: PDZ domain-containing protein [Actinomycetota bacterium]|nr:PDZ domain-containing protein [Actinomycetota bacterium]